GSSSAGGAGSTAAGSVTSGSVTSGSVSSGSVTSGSVTSGSVTSGSVTSGSGSTAAGSAAATGSSPNSAGSVDEYARRNSSSGIVNSPRTSSVPLRPSTTPSGVYGWSRSAHRATNAFSCPRGIATSARAVDSENSSTNGSPSSGK